MQPHSAQRGAGFRSRWRDGAGGAPGALGGGVWVCALAVLVAATTTPSFAAEREGAAEYREVIEPILDFYCLDCHGRGFTKADVSFNDFESDLDALRDRELWHKALTMLNADLMPPKEELQLEPEEKQALREWIKGSVFEIDPEKPDPGRVTLRRLNRVEYRNTIRDLMGVDFDTDAEFPADDTGHGFDNNADVLTISPLLLEKYLDAAQAIVAEAVPTTSAVVAEHVVRGGRFAGEEEEGERSGRGGSLNLPYREPATVTATYEVEHDGDYELVLDFRAVERYVDGQFDYNECKLIFHADGEKLLEEEFVRQGGRPYSFTFDRQLEAGQHELTLEVVPRTPDEDDVRNLRLLINGVTVRGPLDERYWVRPENYERWFPREVPDDPGQRRDYARELLGDFAARAFRRPVDSATVDRLVSLADTIYSHEDEEFEAGIAQAMTAVLASPRFVFREEEAAPGDDPYPLIDEHALASRLSYFLWSTMPDEELIELAGRGELRRNLGAQVDRMLADPRSEQFVRNFVGQWLRARDIESAQVNTFAILRREQPPDPDAERRRERFRELRRKDADELTEEEKQELEEIRREFFRARRRGPRVNFDGRIRSAMRRETEMSFDYLLRENRSALELLDSDYAFLNEPLAEFYEIDGVEVEGDELRRVDLPPDSPRGGVLTQGTVLVVTSNPNRTSPVNRGVFILENILGTPPAPPPPDISALEEVENENDGPLTLREALDLHATQPLCSSCHSRMDPLGLAFENFNALGRWRDDEQGVPIDPSGELITGESFDGIRDLKGILTNERRLDFYRCMTEKMLTYALGRGLEYYDEHTIDELVEALETSGGRLQVLVRGVIESPAFQRRRPEGYPGSVADAGGANATGAGHLAAALAPGDRPPAADSPPASPPPAPGAPEVGVPAKQPARDESSSASSQEGTSHANDG